MTQNYFACQVNMMRDEDKKKIEEIMSGIKCPKNFRCADNGFERLCKAKDFGLDNYLECLEDAPSKCSFALSFGNGHFCQCPLRVFLAKNLKK
jgi:hypothetical protein